LSSAQGCSLVNAGAVETALDAARQSLVGDINGVKADLVATRRSLGEDISAVQIGLEGVQEPLEAVKTEVDAVQESLLVVETKLEAVRAELNSSPGGGAAAPGLLATAVAGPYPGIGAACEGLTVTPSDTSIQFSCDNAGGIEGRCPAGYVAVTAICTLIQGPNTFWGGLEQVRVLGVRKCNTNLRAPNTSYGGHKMDLVCSRV
jgi:hypothetical protein